MIRVEFASVSHVFEDGTTALNGINLTIEPAQAAALIGPNGAGKTTLVKHINGLLKPSSGTVYLDGHDIIKKKPAELASKAGLVFQNPDDQLFLPTVAAEVAYGPQKLGRSAGTIEKAVREALTLTGLAGLQAVNPYNLSWAKRKLLTVASILSMESAMIIMDEPTAGLDSWGHERLAGILRRLKSQGKTILVISHDMDFCAENFDELILMAEGRIVINGPIRDVLSGTRHLSQADLIGPQMVRLADRMEWSEIPLDPAEFIDMLQKIKGKANEEK